MHPLLDSPRCLAPELHGRRCTALAFFGPPLSLEISPDTASLPHLHHASSQHALVQLNAIRAERGEKANEGLEAPMKPLVEVLREAKEAKEEAFQAVWRSMKTGEDHF